MGILVLIDAFLYGALAFGLIKLLFWNNPLGRALCVIGAVAVEIGFLGWSTTPSSDNMPMTLIIIVFIGPISIIIFGAFLNYVFGVKKA